MDQRKDYNSADDSDAAIEYRAKVLQQLLMSPNYQVSRRAATIAGRLIWQWLGQ